MSEVAGSREGPVLADGFHERPWRVVLVGESPEMTSDPEKPLNGRIGAWLKRVAWPDLGERAQAVRFDQAFTCCTLLGEWPGEGLSFPIKKGMVAMERLEPELDGRVVVALGESVQVLMGAGSTFTFWGHRGGFDFAGMPHPSGLNRWWNHRLNREVARGFLLACERIALERRSDGMGLTW